MKQKVGIRETLRVYIKDEEGNIIDVQEFKPPKNKIEEIASRLGILKRHNSVNSMGLHVAAQRFVGTGKLPVQWVFALSSAGNYYWKSSDSTVYSRNVVVANPENTWEWGGAPTAWLAYGAATSNHQGEIVSLISGLEIIAGSGNIGEMWVEIEYDFQ